MRDDLDLVRLSHGGNLLDVCNAAADSNINTGILNLISRQQRLELIDSIKPLAHSNRHSNTVGHTGHHVSILGTNRILYQHGLHVYNTIREGHSLNRHQAAVQLNEEINFIANNLLHLTRIFNSITHLLHIHLKVHSIRPLIKNGLICLKAVNPRSIFLLHSSSTFSIVLLYMYLYT